MIAAVSPALPPAAALRTGATMPTGVAVAPHDLVGLATRPDAELPVLAPTQGNKVQLLTDEGEVLPQLLGSVKGATRQVDLAMFSLADSGAGKEMVDALVDRAQNGVAVHVTLDQVGSAVLPVGSGKDMVQRMRDAGAQVQVTKRFSVKGMDPVDHRKLLVVDGNTAYTGGMNLSKKFGKWHDVMVRVDGPAAAQFGAQFLDRWVDMGGEVSDVQRTLGGAVTSAAAGARALGGGTVASTGTAGAADAAHGVSVLANHPGKDLNASDHLLKNLEQAKDRAYILTPTLSDPAVVDALSKAAQRGVDVRVAVSGPEGWIGTRALGMIGATFYNDLVKAGVKVYEQPGMSHAKVSLVDGIASAGSLNMTRRAMLWDHELMLASDEPAFVGQIEHLFKTDFDRSNPVTAERANEVPTKIGERFRKITGLKW
ncbi:MAG: cardiolipin synthase [Thermoleophilia bacterium]|nr:cardiolipin synthase [Thermoleophilia bacterium]